MNTDTRNILARIAASDYFPYGYRLQAQSLLDGKDQTGGLVSPLLQIAELERQFYAVHGSYN